MPTALMKRFMAIDKDFLGVIIRGAFTEKMKPGGVLRAQLVTVSAVGSR
jgi:hypothetical protein